MDIESIATPGIFVDKGADKGILIRGLVLNHLV